MKQWIINGRILDEKDLEWDSPGFPHPWRKTPCSGFASLDGSLGFDTVVFMLGDSLAYFFLRAEGTEPFFNGAIVKLVDGKLVRADAESPQNIFMAVSDTNVKWKGEPIPSPEEEERGHWCCFLGQVPLQALQRRDVPCPLQALQRRDVPCTSQIADTTSCCRQKLPDREKVRAIVGSGLFPASMAGFQSCCGFCAGTAAPSTGAAVGLGGGFGAPESGAAVTPAATAGVSFGGFGINTSAVIASCFDGYGAITGSSFGAGAASGFGAGGPAGTAVGGTGAFGAKPAGCCFGVSSAADQRSAEPTDRRDQRPEAGGFVFQMSELLQSLALQPRADDVQLLGEGGGIWTRGTSREFEGGGEQARRGRGPEASRPSKRGARTRKQRIRVRRPRDPDPAAGSTALVDGRLVDTPTQARGDFIPIEQIPRTGVAQQLDFSVGRRRAPGEGSSSPMDAAPPHGGEAELWDGTALVPPRTGGSAPLGGDRWPGKQGGGMEEEEEHQLLTFRVGVAQRLDFTAEGWMAPGEGSPPPMDVAAPHVVEAERLAGTALISPRTGVSALLGGASWQSGSGWEGEDSEQWQGEGAGLGLPVKSRMKSDGGGRKGCVIGLAMLSRRERRKRRTEDRGEWLERFVTRRQRPRTRGGVRGQTVLHRRAETGKEGRLEWGTLPRGGWQRSRRGGGARSATRFPLEQGLDRGSG